MKVYDEQISTIIQNQREIPAPGPYEICIWAASSQNQQYRSNFGEVDVAPAKKDKVNNVEKWQKLTAEINPNHMRIFKPWKKRWANLHKDRHEIV